MEHKKPDESHTTQKNYSKEFEDKKEDILLPYSLTVIKLLRDIETHIKSEYMAQKNAMDLKSLVSKKRIEIKIEVRNAEEKNAYDHLVKLIEDNCTNVTIIKNEGIKIVILIMARILRFDRLFLWNEIEALVEGRKKEILQPFYVFKFDIKSNTILLFIKDYAAIPKDFVASYFGYDTGIDGLNILMNGGFMLPPDRSAYISISGEAGIGKTALAVKLVTAFFHNYRFKNIYHDTNESKKLDRSCSKLLSIHYILMEQRRNNILRLIKECDLVNLKNTNIISALNEKQELKSEDSETVTEKKIETIINFAEQDTFSPMGLIEKIENIEKDPENKNKRKVIVIDSVNAIQDVDVSRSEWRELFQSIKAITHATNTIIFFIVEKDPNLPDFVIEYLSDVVIKLYKEYKQDVFYRVMELVESRFQTLYHGRHTFFITNSDSGFIRVYPSSTAMGEIVPTRKRVQPTTFDIHTNKKEVGIKIDGIINFFKYSHLYETQMQPFFLKNSISMFSGDRGSHKSAFARKFALSAFRDERWETSTNYIVEFDYREQEPNKPFEELFILGFWGAQPKEKAITLLLYFSENYDENPGEDRIWETHFGKVIIPGCQDEEKCIGHISHIIFSYEVKGLPEDVYLYQVDEFTRTLESFQANDLIPDTYIKFIKHSSISLLNREEPSSESRVTKVHFNPYNIIYKGKFIRDFEIDMEFIGRIRDLEVRIMGFQKKEMNTAGIIQAIKIKMAEMKNSPSIKDSLWVIEEFEKDFGDFSTEVLKSLKKGNSSNKITSLKNVNTLINDIIEWLLKPNLESKTGRLIHEIDFLRRLLIFDKLKSMGVIDNNLKADELSKLNFLDHRGKNSPLFNYSLFDKNKILMSVDDSSSDEKPRRFNDEVFNYNGVNKIKVSRIILDDAENLANVYTSLNAKKYIATLAHLCLAREITLGIVNTRTRNEVTEVDTVCNAVSDNAFQFDKYFFKGALFTTFHIMRSSAGCHNNMMFYITKQEDDLLQLKNTFALLSDVEKQNPEPIEIRLFLPDLSKEFSKYMYRLLVERDMFMLGYDKDPGVEKNEWKHHFAKRVDFSDHVKVIDPENRLETVYNLKEKFPSNYKDWHDFLKDIITYSLAHPSVKVFTANNPFTDISIILEDESTKDAITILCLPGYLMDLYEKNLAAISDYVHFPGVDENEPLYVHIENDNKFVDFNAKKKETKFGNEFYYLQKASFKISQPNIQKPGTGETDPKIHNGDTTRWIVPEIIFYPTIGRDINTNKVITRNYKDKKYIDIKGYPYFIDTRVNLVFSKGDSAKESTEGTSKNGPNTESNTEPHYFINNTTHDFVALFFEIWFKHAIAKANCIDCSLSTRKLKEKCTFCFFEQIIKYIKESECEKESEIEKSPVENTIEEFIATIIRSVEFDNTGLIKKLKELNEGKEESIVLREWYSSAQLKLSAIEPYLLAEQMKFKISLEIPKCFLYTTWYLAIPVNSPRKDTASEIIIKMTEPPDLAYFQISGIGLQLSKWFYSKDIHKSYPNYQYPEVLEAMENISGKNNGATKKIGIPISSIHCYFDQLTPLGGMLKDTYRYCRNSYPIKSASKDIDIEKFKQDAQKDLMKKLGAFCAGFKAWQKGKKKRCKSCSMTYLFCQYQHNNKQNKKTGK